MVMGRVAPEGNLEIELPGKAGSLGWGTGCETQAKSGKLQRRHEHWESRDSPG